MNRAFKLSAHLLIWTVFYLVMLALVDSILETVGMGNFLNMRVISELAFILLMTLVFPFYIFYFLGKSGLSRRGKLISASVGLVTVLVLPYGYILIDGQPFTAAVYVKMLVLVIFFCMLGYLFRGFLQGLKLKQEKDALQKRMLEAELSFLKGQISPHFLFNTLNNIDSLITLDPEKASHSLISMSEIMRYMIYDTKEDTVMLKQELYYLESLVSLYSLRFSNDGVVNFAINGDVADYRVPPLLLIPIVENAFKHHSKKYNGDGIRVNVFINERKLRMTASNGYDPGAATPASSGFGLQTLRRRLELLYPGQFSLNIDKANNIFNIALELPLRPGELVTG
jgi:two-component system, LytTR family, sensor kinase